MAPGLPKLVPYLHDVGRIEVLDREDRGMLRGPIEQTIAGHDRPNLEHLASSIRAYASARS